MKRVFQIIYVDTVLLTTGPIIILILKSGLCILISFQRIQHICEVWRGKGILP